MQTMRRRHHYLLIALLLILAVSVLPIWPHSADWGYIPSTGFGLIFLVVMALLLLGRL